MSPDDPRHGTTAGYARKCRCGPCSDAIYRYMKMRRLEGGSRVVSVIGTRRRVQALAALGWPIDEQSRRLGYGDKALGVMIRPRRRERVRTSLAEKVAALYDELSMTLGPSDLTRRRAAKKGWLPPLAWDDGRIDDPDYMPVMRPEGSRIRELDPVVVERVLSGERMDATPAEKAEVIRRWRASGRSLNDLERLTGINPHRGYREAV